jgi:UDP-N-acetylmuramoyl-tripeptide--D-alanyl-D-alanine ligase
MPAAFTAAEIINASHGSLVQGRAGDTFVGVSTDSRTCQAGGLFIPLKGEHHDGHDYIPKAISRGVRGVVVEERVLHANGVMTRVPLDVTTVAVADTLTVLGSLARAWRRRFPIPVVSLTGSCGKTTAKEMTAQVLSRFYRVLKNELNLNNLIGLPQTLLRLDGSFDAAVVEMGMNRFGEIRRLTEISEPTVGVLLNVHPAHTEGVGCVEGVCRAKAELIQALSPEATLVFNTDDPRVAGPAGTFPGRCLGFGFGPGADLRALSRQPRGREGQTLEAVWQGKSHSIFLPVPGEHQAMNALAAIAAALAVGLPFAEAAAGLADFRAMHRRSQVQDLPSGAHLLNDCYNANPGSMATALATLMELKGSGRAAAALGDMLELGTHAVEAHRELGRQLARAGLDFLVTYGNFREEVVEGAQEAGLSPIQLFPVTTKEEAARLLQDFLKPGDWLLVKGSRSMHMETIIELLEELEPTEKIY